MTAKITPPPNLTVAALAYDGLASFEFGIAIEVFGLPRPEFDPWYRFVVCAERRGDLRAVGGFTVRATAGLPMLARAGTIVIPGWRGAATPVPPAILAAIRRAHAHGARLLTICSGVFVLAQAGLLDGRRATTHWRYTETLRRLHPRVIVDPDVLYVDEGTILTSAGSAAGIDLCLHLVRRDFGPARANEVARRMVVPPHREGGQAQFIPRPMPPKPGRFSAALDWARARLDHAIPVAAFAREAGMSLRSFQRRFREATGLSPADWLLAERVGRAKELLETTALPVERIATACGFGAADTLRHHFRTRLGTSPRAWRARFRAA